jgi:hypothetical protein
MKKFLLASAALMLLFYAMAVPFVQHYSSLESPGEYDMEHALALELQMTSSLGLALVILVFLAALWVYERYKPNL